MATSFADKLGVFETLPDHADNANQKPARVGVFALVEPEGLFIQIPEQMKRLDADIRSTNGAL